MNIRIKRIAKWLAILVVVLLLLAAIVPFLIPLSPLDDVGLVEQSAAPESRFVTIPFEGTDGIDIHYLTDQTDETVPEEPTFVLLHGSLFNVFTWNDVIDFSTSAGA